MTRADCPLPIRPAGECWVFTGAKNGHGYGVIKRGRRNLLAHRYVFELAHGPIPAGAEVDHVADRGCTSRACVNPDHLEAVSHAENCRRGSRAKLSAADAAEIRASTGPAAPIAERFGITTATVYNIRNGQRWATG